MLKMTFFTSIKRHKIQGHFKNNPLSKHSEITSDTELICNSSPNLSIYKVVSDNEMAVRDVFNSSTGSHFWEVDSQKHRPTLLLEDLTLSKKALGKLPWKKKNVTQHPWKHTMWYASNLPFAAFTDNEELLVKKITTGHHHDQSTRPWISGEWTCPQVICTCWHSGQSAFHPVAERRATLLEDRRKNTHAINKAYNRNHWADLPSQPNCQ